MVIYGVTCEPRRFAALQLHGHRADGHHRPARPRGGAAARAGFTDCLNFIINSKKVAENALMLTRLAGCPTLSLGTRTIQAPIVPTALLTANQQLVCCQLTSSG